MRVRKAFLSMALVTAAGLLMAAAAMADFDFPPRKCTVGSWKVEVVDGPCAVADPANPSCGQGSNTGIQYKVTILTGSAFPDSISTLVTVNNTVSTATGNYVFPACQGDLATDLGERSCHEQAVRVAATPVDSLTETFWVVVAGTHKQPVPTSVVTKKKLSVQSAAILGLGLDLPEGCVSTCGNFDPDQTLKKVEIVDFKGCSVEFDTSLTTGAVLNVTLLPVCSSTPTGPCSTNASCSFYPGNVSDLQLYQNGVGTLGTGNFGDGTISTGSNSCTTRIIGGKVYTWGSAPCP